MMLLLGDIAGLSGAQLEGAAALHSRAGILDDAAQWLGRSQKTLGTLFRGVQPASNSMVDAVTHMLAMHDPETLGHSQRVARYALTLGDAMGLDRDQLGTLQLGGLLHDIGKISVPEKVLRKTTKLDDWDWQQLRGHPEHGDKLLRHFSALQPALPVVRHHHERYDGNGYPDKLKGLGIPLAARIFAVIDTFDAMTSDRPYRRALSDAEAQAEIERGAGSQFDPRVVERFLAVDSQKWSALTSACASVSTASSHLA